MALEVLSIQCLKGIRHADKQGTLGFGLACDPDSQPLGLRGAKDRGGQAVGISDPEQRGIVPGRVGTHVLGFLPERGARITATVDGKSDGHPGLSRSAHHAAGVYPGGKMRRLSRYGGREINNLLANNSVLRKRHGRTNKKKNGCTPDQTLVAHVWLFLEMNSPDACLIS